MEFLKTTSVAGASHASSGRIITVDADRVNPDAAPQSAPRAGLGLVELRDGRHTIVWADHSGGVPGTAAGQAAGRGLYARWLYRPIAGRGWHPFLRINQGGQFRPHAAGHFRPLATAAPRVATGWSGVVDCFVTRECRLTCTLLARWEAQYAEPWLIVTDLAPEVADVAWYGMRTWIECGFKDSKRGGWQWQQTKMTDPERASRHWLAIAVATLWVVSVGGEA